MVRTPSEQKDVAERKKMYGCVAISCFAKVKSYIINMQVVVAEAWFGKDVDCGFE